MTSSLGCTLAVRLKPKAKRDQIVFSGAAAPLQIAVTSPPVDNSANEHCIALLAKRLGVPKSTLRIVKGGHCRDKVIACDGMTQMQAYQKLGGDG